MNFTKLFALLPAVALACCFTGCSPDNSATVIEAEPQSAEEIEKADEAYGEASSTSLEGYEN